MPKSSAPRLAPMGKQWCARHKEGRGAFLDEDLFPSDRYSYCKECKREYQRAWEREHRVSERRPMVPEAKLSKNEKRIILHLPNDEKGRNHVRQLLSYYSNAKSF